MDARFGVVDLALGLDQFVARAQGLCLHSGGVGQDVLQQPPQLGDAAGAANGLRIAGDAVVVLAGAGGHAVEAIDEGHHHVAHGVLGFGDALLEQALLVHHLAQAAAGLFQGVLVQRPGDQLADRADLPLQPAAVVEQLAHVFQQQVEQAEQQVLLLMTVFGAQADLVAELAHALLEVLQRLSRVPTAQGIGQRLRFLGQRAVALQGRGQGGAQARRSRSRHCSASLRAPPTGSRSMVRMYLSISWRRARP